jgi:hypothetical protein
MQISADGTTQTAALVAALAVVSEAGENAAQRLRVRVEDGTTGVILEAGEQASFPGGELAREQDVADHPPLARDRAEREEPDARKLGAAPIAVEAPEKLVPAADRQDGGARGRRLEDCLPLAGEVGRDERLLAILPASDVEEVVLAGHELSAEVDRAVVELDSTPGGPPLEHGDVAAIGVDVVVLGVVVPDDDLRFAASQ